MRAVIGIRPSQVAQTGEGPTPTVWFDSVHQLAGVLSEDNRDLLRLIAKHQPRTVSELATLSGRAASNLSRTLRTLEQHQLVALHRSDGSRAVRPEVLATEFLVLLD